MPTLFADLPCYHQGAVQEWKVWVWSGLELDLYRGSVFVQTTQFMRFSSRADLQGYSQEVRNCKILIEDLICAYNLNLT